MCKTVVKMAILVILLFSIALPLQAAEQHELNGDAINEVLELINAYPVDNPEKAVLVEERIKGLMEEIDDPYTYYMNPDEFKIFNNQLANNYIGIGVMFEMREHFPVITEVFQNTPAEKAGIKAGDLLVKVNDRSVADLTVQELYTIMDGAEGASLNITVRRLGTDDIDLVLTQGIIHVPAASYEILDNNVGYINLSQFSDGSAREFMMAAFELEKQGATKLIMDLRGNPGGSLEEAVKIADLFLSPGSTIIRITDYNGYNDVISTAGLPLLSGMRTVVLVNGQSASASECLSGALQDHYAAIILGEKTYGKGSMQRVYQLESGAAVSITIAKYYTPLSNPVDGVGITPDYQIITPGLQQYFAQRLFKPYEENVVVFYQDSDEMLLNETPIQINNAVIGINNRVYLPLRAAFEALGYRVDWLVGDDGTVSIGTNMAQFGYDDFEMHFEGDTLYVALEELYVFGINYEINGNAITIWTQTH